ncbi:MAG: adenylosuccinate lyase [Planctomycetes bacterium]|nr:adenylosuccinate lyase [Planctomycetota bacterium]
MNSVYDAYSSPLASRNASPAMLRLWSSRHKFNSWRRIWLAVAAAQHQLGLPVSAEQVAELRAAVARGISDDEIHAAEKYERELRHDVMAHVHALGDTCPKARPIIHLGMTSQDVNDNADLLILTDSIRLISDKVEATVAVLGGFAARYAAVPTLAMTHYQPAQPTTVGRRAVSWAFDLHGSLVLPRDHWNGMKGFMRGLKGATGTQASYLALFGNDHAKVDALERAFLAQFDLDADDFDCIPFTNQTYPRVIEAQLLAALASVASVLHKIATDLRLLCNRKEIDEPFEEKQIGSSAMPYKRNPMRCERICGLTRFVMNLAGNAFDTAATQWLERTLDDSSNRRLCLPESFLALDGALDLMLNVGGGLIVHEATVRKNLMAELPFMATENLLMAAVQSGGDRQHYHELIRVHAQASGMRVKQEGLENDLLDRLKADPSFRSKSRGGSLDADLDWSGVMDPMKYIGRSVQQTERFVRDIAEPLRKKHAMTIDALSRGGPRV